MSKYDGLLFQFSKYANEFATAGLKPSRADIEEFMVKFFKQTMFQMGTVSWDAKTTVFRGANYRDKQTGKPLYVIDTKKTTKENIDEIRPVLHEAFLREHKSFGVPVDNFDPKPIVPSTNEEQMLHESMKAMAYRYNQLTLPFRLRKTMHHELQAVLFRNAQVMTSQRFTLHSEKEIREYIDATSYGTGMGKHGGSNKGLRDIWWRPNPSGNHPKVGVIDLDNPAEMPFDELARVTYDIAKRLSLIHSTLVLFTGKTFHIWFATKPMTFETVQECWDYTYSAIMKATPDVAFNREEAITRRVPFVDKSPMSGKTMTRMLFGMHYKPALEDSTGYCAIPVALDRVKKFNPQEAHPVAVMRDFERLKGMADAWFISAEVGDGFEETEAAPPCFRIPTDNPDKENPLVVKLQAWKKQPWTGGSGGIRYRDIGNELLQHPRLVVTPKYDGNVGLLAFNKRGGFKVHGKRLDSRKGASRAGMDVERSVMVTARGGVIGWDNYLTREFERICQDNDVDSIEVVVESIVVDGNGRVMGNEESRSILATGTDNHDPTTFRRLKAVIVDVLSVDGKDVSSLPFEERIMKAADLEGDRIRCVDPTVVEDDYEATVQAIWRSQVQERMNEGLIVYAGDRRYKVKRKYTIDGVIMGIYKGKVWQDKKPRLASILIGVSKKTNEGMAFVPVGRAINIPHEEGKKLFKEVLGEQTGEYGQFEHAVRNPGLEERYPDIQIVDPRVIVEVDFQKLSNRRSIAGPTLLRKPTRGHTGFQMGLSVTKSERYVRKLVGPANFLRVRYDKDIEDSADYSFRQGDGAGGFKIGVRADPMVNPALMVSPDDSPSAATPLFVSKTGLTSVMPNPFYGYAAGPRWVSGGRRPFMLPEHPGLVFEETPIGHKPVQPAGKQGGRTSAPDDWLTLKQEFADQLQSEEGKWGLHYDPQKIRFPKDKDGIAYFLDIPGFALGSDDAIYDEEGPNIGGVVSDKNREEVRYHNQLLMDYMVDEEQKARDGEVAALANLDQRSFQSFPVPVGELPDEEFDATFYDQQAENIASQFARLALDSKADNEKRNESRRRVLANPEHTEDSKSKKSIARSERGVIRPFDAFMVFEGEGEEE